MKKIALLFILSSLILIMACASFGKQFDVGAAKQSLKIGQSTKEDVLHICGEPLSKQSSNDLEVWSYAFIEKNITPLGYITRFFVGGTEWETQTQKMDIIF